MSGLDLSLHNSSGASLLAKPANWLNRYFPIGQQVHHLIPQSLKKALHSPEIDKEPVRKPSMMSSWFNRNFYLGSKYARREMNLGDLEKATQAKANISVKELQPGKSETIPLELYSIKPKMNPSMKPFALFSGIKSSAIYKAGGIQDFTEAGIPTKVANYRGFGNSYGQHEVSQDSLIEDGRAIVNELASESKEINILGHSLGSAISAKALSDLTEKQNIDSCNMVIVAGWDDMNSVCNECPRISIKVISWLLRNYAEGFFGNNWDTGTHLTNAISNIAKSLEGKNNYGKKFRFLIVHGTKDDLVSIHQARKLEAKLRTKIASLDPKIRDYFEVVFKEVPGAGHFSQWRGDVDIPYKEIISMLKPS